MRVSASVLAITLLGSFGCDDAVKATATATKAGQSAADGAQKAVGVAAKNATDSAGKAATDAIDKAKASAIDTAKTAIDGTKAAGARAWANVPPTGELSKNALVWLQDTAESTDIRGIVVKGVQIAPVAVEIGLTINAAVDSETAIEPIYQALDGRDPAEIDKAIGSMPRVEVVDGVKVGFTQLNRTDAGASVDERAYLITWRRDDHIVGMVYRTKRTIDLDMLVKEAPRLVALTQSALAKTP